MNGVIRTNGVAVASPVSDKSETALHLRPEARARTRSHGAMPHSVPYGVPHSLPREKRHLPHDPRPAQPVEKAPIAPPPLAAERPDAAPRNLHSVVRASAHALILLSVVSFVVYYCVIAPAWARFSVAFGNATARLVAVGWMPVLTPDVQGVFVADESFSPGDFVRKGKRLGRILSPKLDKEIERAETELRGLQLRRLQLEQQSGGGERQWQADQEAREIAGRVGTASQTLAQLHALRRQLTVCAPADGFIQGGLSGSKSVTPHQAIVSIYPKGADILVEVKAPMGVLNDLQRKQRVVVEFETPYGKSHVVAVPIRSSVQPFTKTVAGKPDETWGVLQCRPSSALDSECLPGLIGKLR
jgi:hypothetical protein